MTASRAASVTVAWAAQGSEGGSAGREERQSGDLAVVDPLYDADFVAAVGEFVVFLLGDDVTQFGVMWSP
ncbi:hypothetical protein [Streptomyces sp. ISL-100]|uniref:hypothetical protein n=1 Tax=Streptomyces sp. ISL-100 TaxID=2819173 RepID=UPI001BEBA7EA|nr:hypothetical protein [Streptomyces sp. ISL-100]MBT2400863.1 hypothetical protein [Streptomyces sp. ISL-100]